MTRRFFEATLLVSFVFFTAGAVLAQGPETQQPPPMPKAATEAQCADSVDTKAEVPALREMHEVIYPLWHQAWPDKNMKMMKDLLPQVRERVEAVRTAVLPGILRDKKADWDAGVSSLIENEKAYEDAVAKDDLQATLDAVESLHGRFEGLLRLTFPPMKQLDDYHVVLYRIYHHSMPAKDLAAVRAESEELSARAKVLDEVPLPKRYVPKEKEIKSAISQLWTATETLRMTAKGDDVEAVNAAVEKVHTQYREVEALFR